MKKCNNSGFTLVELMIVIGIIAVLMGLVVVVAPGFIEGARNTKCINNLKNIYAALQLYKNRYKKYPDEAGDLFLATLYYTGILTDYETFTCPTDASNDGAAFTDETAENIGVIPDGWEDGDPSPKDDWGDDTVGPTEISYAARWNVKRGRDHPEEKWYHLNDDPKEATPLVCDDFEDEDGEIDKLVLTHDDDHVNVLYSGGKIVALRSRVRVGEKGKILEALKN